jgi:hypothetical protein
LATVFKLNKFLTFVFSQISLAPFIPFIIGISMFLVLFSWKETDFSHQELNLEMVKNNLLQYIIGSFIFATLLALVGFTFFYLWNFSEK